MHLHYMEYLEAVGPEELCRIVGDWIDRNPPYGRGYWIDAWGSYTVSIRTVVWMQQLARRRAALPGPFFDRMVASLLQQLRFLERNLERDLGGNHLIKNVKALLWAARFFEGDEASRFGALGERLLAGELAEQVLPDGVHYERSPSYHAQVFADLLEIATVLPTGAARESLWRRLPDLAQALSDLTHPDGLPGLWNDAGLHTAYPAATCLDAYRAVTGRAVAQRPVFALEAAGYFGARAGASYVVADCGPVAPDFLPAHAHGDILSFEWTVEGLRLVVDAGVYEYVAGPMRDYVRSTWAHNTVTVDDADQCEFYGAFRMGRRARTRVHAYEPRGDGFVLEGSHDGYRRLAGAPVPRRRIEATPARIEVQDVVEHGAGQRVRARLLFHPECRVTVTDRGVRIERGGVRVRLKSDSKIRIETGWFCPDFGVRIDAPRIVLEYGAAPCAGGFTLSRESLAAPSGA